jgi:tRNA(His) guanylyltransferase
MQLSDRIKEFYEDRTKQFLMRRQITIIRLDGKGFSKFTKKLNKPFDNGFSDDMDNTTKFLCENIQGVKFGYTQSDEITLVLTDFDNLESSAWFDYNVQKMVSIAASIATARFNQLRMYRYFSGPEYNITVENDLTIGEHYKPGTNLEEVRDDIASFINYMPIKDNLAMFDARVFQVPTIDEMVNTIIWRQQDCTRNSVSMAASAYFPHKQLEGKSSEEKQEMLFTLKGINWNDYKPKYKRGSVIKKENYQVPTPIDGNFATRSRWIADADTPIITQDKNYLINLIPII